MLAAAAALGRNPAPLGPEAASPDNGNAEIHWAGSPRLLEPAARIGIALIQRTKTLHS
jgi:hypothetical protein